MFTNGIYLQHCYTAYNRDVEGITELYLYFSTNTVILNTYDNSAAVTQQ